MNPRLSTCELQGFGIGGEDVGFAKGQEGIGIGVLTWASARGVCRGLGSGFRV